ncbi:MULTISPECIES: carbon storage regulator CsrA [unclassified Dehalobacter]|uniref:carbon storage regulator CsrA n=1 Tax=unclassified Dehalobacter TaxID=2635733 RepID=UPI00037A5035|nr:MULTISPECIES: carbon storage regulator CsrA [unclassified Dehalobacter]RJE48788.1 carbon storage regulator [Dehalobacter sp. MCB1]TCX51879.1 carbon storage regulator [Dehalobacter sp. 14DCB1]TCX52939.1 carbon storage regulator [Dehalobacter sp. 12DCB1]
MLVLSRKINERIMIGDNIEIVVVAVVGDQVRIGIEAPKDIKILRSEVYEEVQNQNVKASAASKLPEAELSGQLKQMLKGNLPGNKE